jgi:hypothetical protein
MKRYCAVQVNNVVFYKNVPVSLEIASVSLEMTSVSMEIVSIHMEMTTIPIKKLRKYVTKLNFET